ncbi:hypothetical protein JOC94_004102 [Bacillus thermophilus]|uniref:Uncharacterized protein n=1 Tax=Siminovitchia thermophila TaxID=1245522 RepID=A0ABS2RBN9_9BACI|nr:hypothetical protein [Siminovitchia thermophila]
MMATTGKQNWIIINEAKVELFPKSNKLTKHNRSWKELGNRAYQPDFFM